MGTTKSDRSNGNGPAEPLDLGKAIELSEMSAIDRAICLGMLNLHNVLENVIVNTCAGLTEWPDWVNVHHLADQVRSLVGPHIVEDPPRMIRRV